MDNIPANIPEAKY